MSSELQSSKVQSLQSSNMQNEGISLKANDCIGFGDIHHEDASFGYSLLDDVAEVIDSLHKTPSYTNLGFPMVRVTDVKYGELQLDKTLKVDEPTFHEFSRRYAPKPGDIVITRVGTYGVSAQVKDVNFCLGQNTAAIIPKSINPRYLYAALNSTLLRDQIESSVVGSTQKTLSLKCIKALKIPRLNERSESSIAELIGGLDDRIVLLRKINATLEAMAQALFKSWFVDFDPVHANAGTQAATLSPELQALFPATLTETPQGLVPEGWLISTVGDSVDIVGGATPDTKNDDFWNPAEFAWTSPKDLSGLQSPVLLATDRKVSALGLKKISSGLLPVGTLLLSSRAPIGYLAISQVPIAINQGYIAMPPGATLPPLFMLFWCQQNMEIIKNRANGSTFMEISKKAFRPIELALPPAAVIEAFVNVAQPLFDRLVENEKQAQTLATLRDTLLPRLISGQLRLPDAEAVLAEAVA